MKLRARLALTTVLVMVPLAIAVVLIEQSLRSRETNELLKTYVDARLLGDGRARCARSPVMWARPAFLPPGPPMHPPDLTPPPGMPPRPPPPPPGMPMPPIDPMRPSVDVVPYDANLQSSLPFGPPLEPELLAAAREGRSGARVSFGERPRVDAMLVRANDSGPCTWIVARRPRPPAPIVPLQTWVPAFAALFVAIGIATVPLVRRIRKLDRAVRDAARDRYETKVVKAVGGGDEVTELAAAFDDAGTEVRAQMDAQAAREETLRDFLANTTHDVMTPLTVLQGHLAAMRDSQDPSIVAAAIDEAQYMSALVHNLGVAARLEAGEPHVVRAPVDIGALIERVIARHRPIAQQHRIEIACAIPEERVTIEGDETFLEQMIGNVVFNAIRHNREGGHVAVLIENDTIVVRDDGPGIPKEERARVVERHARGASAERRGREGRGLGLSIAKRVAELHGLRMELDDAEGGGLEVRFVREKHS